MDSDAREARSDLADGQSREHGRARGDRAQGGARSKCWTAICRTSSTLLHSKLRGAYVTASTYLEDQEPGHGAGSKSGATQGGAVQRPYDRRARPRGPALSLRQGACRRRGDLTGAGRDRRGRGRSLHLRRRLWRRSSVCRSGAGARGAARALHPVRRAEVPRKIRDLRREQLARALSSRPRRARRCTFCRGNARRPTAPTLTSRTTSGCWRPPNATARTRSNSSVSGTARPATAPAARST